MPIISIIEVVLFEEHQLGHRPLKVHVTHKIKRLKRLTRKNQSYKKYSCIRTCTRMYTGMGSFF